MPASDKRDAVVRVDAAQVAQIWPQARPLIARAYHGRGRHDDDLAAIEADVLAGASVLWIVCGEAGLIAAGTTKIMQTPLRKVLRIECWAGRDMPRWLGGIRAIEDYGRAHGCAVCRIEGRKGWKAMLPDYREPYVVLEKDL